MRPSLSYVQLAYSNPLKLPLVTMSVLESLARGALQERSVVVNKRPCLCAGGARHGDPDQVVQQVVGVGGKVAAACWVWLFDCTQPPKSIRGIFLPLTRRIGNRHRISLIGIGG